MDPPLTADAATLINWSLSNNRVAHFFTSRLGLPQKRSDNEKGRTIFEGRLALASTSLYRSMLKIRTSLLVRFGTKQRLRAVEESQRQNLMTEVTKRLFAPHGPFIWSASPPFSTVIDVANYPKHLKHDNSSDRERIILYLYCWTITQLPRSKPKKASSGRRTNTRKSQVYDLSDDDDDNDGVDDDYCDEDIYDNGCDAGEERNEGDDALDNDVEFVEADDHGGQSSTRVSHVPDGGYSIPVAQMLPRSPHSNAIADRPGRLQRVTTRAALDQEHTIERPTHVSGGDNDENDNLDLYILPSPPSRSIKRRGYSTRDQGQNKKLKGNAEDLADNVETLSSPRNRASRVETHVRMQGRDSYPSPPAVPQENPRSPKDMRNFPNVGHTEQARADASDTEDVVQDVPVLSQGPEIDATANDSGSDDGDSVQGTEHVQSFIAISEPLDSVVPISITAHLKDTESLRCCLGSNLLDVLPTGLHQLDIPLLSRTIEVIEELTKAEHIRLREIYENDFNSFNEALDQWLECLKLLFQFWEITEFRGDLTSRKSFLDNLPKKPRVEAMRMLTRGSSFLRGWRNDEHRAKKVATMLSNLVWPQSWWTPDTMELLVLDFSKELLEWFS